MGEEYKMIETAKELFKIQKTSDHWATVSRSKEFLSKDFFPPREVPYDTNLQSLFSDSSLSEEEVNLKLLDIIPNLNFDQVVELSLYLVFETKINDKAVWRLMESAFYESLHLYSVKQLCQVAWACSTQKPKHTTARFTRMLEAEALKKIDQANVHELC